MGVHRRFPSLKTIEGVRANMERIYREARREELDVQAATKLCYILVQLAGLIETGDLEKRIEALEGQTTTKLRSVS